MKNIGILFPPSTSGGVFQFAQSIANSLIDHVREHRYSIIHFAGERPNLFCNDGTAPAYMEVTSRALSMLKKMMHVSCMTFGTETFLRREFDEELKKAQLDLLIVPTPFTFYLPLSVPYVTSIPDLNHKYFTTFPEYGTVERMTRDIVYKYYADHSLFNVVDSEQGADDVVRYLKGEREKCRVIPYIPPNYAYRYRNMHADEARDIVSAFQLPERYIFFPAQFWFQKNHARLIRALQRIKSRTGERIPLVLVGNSGGIYQKNFNQVMALADELGVRDQVHQLGYVTDREIVALYKMAAALVAPSFQGPTTIPPLESMLLGTPVVTVDIFEVPKQVGDAGLLFDPTSVDDMADKILLVWKDSGLRETMIERGRQKCSGMTQQNYAQLWGNVVSEALSRL